MFIQQIDMLESTAIDLVAKVAPWAAPLPTAYLVGRATVNHLAWPGAIGVVAAIVIETLGLASTTTALELRQYNQGKRKSDPQAPFWLAAALVLVYFVVATGLTVALDILPALAFYAPAIFPTLSLTGVTALALRSDHRRRVQAIAQDKAGRRASRRARKGERTGLVSGNVKVDNVCSAAHAARRAKKEARMGALVDFYRANPLAGVTEASAALNVSRQTVYTYLGQLEEECRVRRNGSGIEVVQ